MKDESPAPPGPPELDPVTFPRLNEAEMEEAAAFGQRCRFAVGERLFSAGDRPFDCFLIISGEICIIDISTGTRRCVVRYGRGHFTGDIDLFTHRPAVVSCEAESAVEAVRIAPARLREMFVRKAVLGERFWRAFQRRREFLLETEFSGLSVYGDRNDRKTLEVVELLFRNGVPHRWLDTQVGENVAGLKEIKADVGAYPVVTYGRQMLFEAPTIFDLASHIGLRRELPEKIYDVLVLGAGPSGLGAAVYAASEGLSTLVLDGLGPGGQAGSSSRIENYAGFPNGISGRELAQLSYLQALKFGAEFLSPSNSSRLARRTDGLYEIGTHEGDKIVSKTVIVATGVSYRLLAVEGLRDLKGSGVYYNATKVEALLCHHRPVHVIGAGNSAGQAAMFLSQYSPRISLVVRGDNLQKSMSSYLSERVLSNERIEIRYQTEVQAIEGVEHIEAVHLRDQAGKITREETAGLFIFIGARPRTDFLPDSIGRDDRGFVLTGAAVAELPGWTEARLPCALETTLPGVFASGDCRSGTTKRVAFAIGDGALAVTCVHDFLGTYT